MNKDITIHSNLTEEEWLKLREGLITSTGMSAILNVSSFKTAYEYWHELKGDYKPEFEETDRIRWGRRLEEPIAYGLAEDNNWTVEPFKDFLVNEKLRAGSSFDFKIIKNPDRPGKTGILEIKTVDGLQFKDNWIVEDGEVIEAPPYIEVQAQFQLYISGLDYIVIGALVGGNKPVTIYREPDQEIFEIFDRQIARFNELLDSDTPPPPDLTADAELISRIYSSVTPGTVWDCNGDATIENLVDEYRQAHLTEKEASDYKKAIKSQILMMIGDTEKVKNDHFSISAGYTGPTMIPAYERKGYRNLKVFFKGKYKEQK